MGASDIGQESALFWYGMYQMQKSIFNLKYKGKDPRGKDSPEKGSIAPVPEAKDSPSQECTAQNMGTT